MRNLTPSDLLTVSQAADELGVPSRTLHYRISTGKIHATKVGTGRTNAYVITRAEVERVRETSAA